MKIFKPFLISRSYLFRGTQKDFDDLLAGTDDFDFTGTYFSREDEYEFQSQMSIGTMLNQAGQTDGIRIFAKMLEVNKKDETLTIELFTRLSGGIILGIVAGLVIVMIGLTESDAPWLIGLGFVVSFAIIGIYRVQQSILMQAVQNCFRMKKIKIR